MAIIVGNTSFVIPKSRYKLLCMQQCTELQYYYICVHKYTYTYYYRKEKCLVEPHIRDLCKYPLATSLKANQDSNNDCKPTSHKKSFIHRLVDMTCDWYNVSISENDCT